jgi:hypothetical protein
VGHPDNYFRSERRVLEPKGLELTGPRAPQPKRPQANYTVRQLPSGCKLYQFTAGGRRS